MYNINICLAVVLLVGCGTAPSTDVDAGVPDSAVPDTDAMMEVRDAGTDAADADAGARTDAPGDAGRPDASPDAGTPTDAGVDAAMPEPDSGAEPDAGTDAGMTDAGAEGPGTPIDIGVSGDGSCLLTDNNEMWCWGYGNVSPIYVADAVALEGTCGIALDGHAFCWSGAGITDYAGTDVAVLGVQGYVARTDGLVRSLGLAAPTWAPPSPVAAMPALGCAVLVDGGLTCWDRVPGEYRNFWEAVPSASVNDVTDAARRGSFGADDIVVCYAWDSTPTVQCHHSRGTATPPAFADAVEVEIAGGRACTVVPVDGDLGDHPAGIYCTADRPATFGSTGHWPLNPLPAGDAYMNAYTDIVGTDLALGANHACIMQGSNILCWGDNRRGQLGDGTSVSSRTPESIVW